MLESAICSLLRHTSLSSPQVMPESAIRFWTYDAVKVRICRDPRCPSLQERLFAGGLPCYHPSYRSDSLQARLVLALALALAFALALALSLTSSLPLPLTLTPHPSPLTPTFTLTFALAASSPPNPPLPSSRWPS